METKFQIILSLVIFTTLGLSHGATTPKNYTGRAKFLILGGGVAGLTAATALSDAGEDDFIILEGSARIGGRLKSGQIGGYTVEMGSALLYLGGDADPIRNLADMANVTYVKADYDSYAARDASGNDITDEADVLYESFEPALEDLGEVSEQLAEDPDKFIWKDASARSMLGRYGWYPQDTLAHAIEFWDIDFAYGAMSEVVSVRKLKEPFYDENEEHEDYIIVDQNGGISKIADSMSKKFMKEDDDRLILNSKVIKIMNLETEVVVELDNGDLYAADYVIVTFSLGVLQDPTAVTFEPALPDWKLDALAQLSISQDISIYINFENSVEVFWGEEEWTLFANKYRGYFPIMINYNKLMSGVNILQFNIVDDEARRISRLTDDQIKAEIQDVLMKFYNQSTAPQVKDILVTRWTTDPLFYGSYSDWPVGFSDDSHEALRASVGRIYFAGEAFHEKWYGYINGAVHSAEEQTAELLGCVKDSSQCKVYSPPQKGCTYDRASNYNSKARYDDGSCKFDKTSVASGVKATVMMGIIPVCLSLMW